LSEAEPLIAEIERFGEAYQPEVTGALLWRMGRRPVNPEADRALVQVVETALRETGVGIDRFFFDAFGQALPQSYGAAWDEVRAALDAAPLRAERTHPFWSGEPCAMLIEEVEAIWRAIAEHDDWAPFHAKIASIRAMGAALA
jgi:hypothetical protein